MIAIPWYFTKMGDATLFGYLYVGITAVSLFWGPFCGTLVDKYDRKRIFLVVSAVMAVIVLCVSGYGYLSGSVPWWLVGLVYLVTFMDYNIHYPNLYAFSQEITEPRYYGKITSYIEIQGQVSSMLAGAFAAMLLDGSLDGNLSFFGFDIYTGWVFEAWDIHRIFLIDGLTYLSAIAIIYFIRYQSLIRRKPETGSIQERLALGWNWLKSNPRVLTFGIASYGIFIIVLVSVFYNNPIYIENHLLADAGVYASSEMYYSLGAIIAGIAIRYIFDERRISIPASIIIMTFLTAGLFFMLNFTKGIFIFYFAMLLLGVTNAGTRIQRVTFLFRRIPNQYYGRANSIFFISNILFRICLLSVFALPFFHRDNHVAMTMGIMGMFLVVAGGILVWNHFGVKSEK